MTRQSAMRPILSVACLLAAPALLFHFADPCRAQIAQEPFWDQRPPRGQAPRGGDPADGGYLPPMDRRLPAPGEALPADQANIQEQQAPLDERDRSVERIELAPVMASDGSGLPYELWQGLSVSRIEELIAALQIPPRSAALHALWRRLITSDVSAPTGSQQDSHFAALRVEALYRSGLLTEAAEALARSPATPGDRLQSLLAARNAVARADTAQGCAGVRELAQALSELPKSLLGEAILVSGYCAAVAGNALAAAAAAELARESSLEPSAGIEALEAIALGSAPKALQSKRIGVLDYRILQLSAYAASPDEVLAGASPALLAALALDPATEPVMRLHAAEAAAVVNAITPEDLAAIYRTRQVGPEQPARSSSTTRDGAPYRATLFQDAEAERTPLRKARLVRAFLDEARRSGLYWPALQLMAAPAEALQPVPEVGWFAETGIETALAAGRYDRARQWASFAAGLDRPVAGDLRHWLVLADLADPAMAADRSLSLAIVEDLAIRGRLDPVLLHRLATVLDALDIQVPIPLWEVASRTPQPAGGHLPETGVLTELQTASKKKEFGHTILLAMQTLGPDGAEGAHMIALGDAIRALKRSGLDADARRLGLEALFAAWPRAVGQ